MNIKTNIDKFNLTASPSCEQYPVCHLLITELSALDKESLLSKPADFQNTVWLRLEVRHSKWNNDISLH